MGGGFMFRGGFFIRVFFSVAAFASLYSEAKLVNANEQKARELLTKKVLKLSQDLDMREGSYPDAKGGGGKEVNANDQNAFTSDTTYHSYTWDYCNKWIGGRYCEEWTHPYISMHGKGGDRSPLEGLVYSEWENSNRQDRTGGEQGQFAIWDIEAKGNYLKNDGTLDRRSITKWKLTDNVKRKVEQVGYNTANRQIMRTYDGPEARDGKVMPNMEALRTMSGRWTKMFRNRLVSNIGETRAIQPGIEVAQGEDIPDCRDYLNELRNNRDRSRQQERIDPQKLLDPRTMGRSPQQRMQACMRAKNANVYAVNVGANGKARQKENEWADMALSRANLVAVDRAGVDPREGTELDERLKITDNDVKQDIADYEVGGQNMRVARVTNMQQLNSYNKALDEAAAGYQEVAARAPNQIRDRSRKVQKWKIGKGQMNLVKLNDLTPEMRSELKGTNFPRAEGTPIENDPGDNLETTPSELVVRTR